MKRDLKTIDIQNNKCFYCEVDLIPQFPNQTKQLPDNPTKDHIVPVSEFKPKLRDKSDGLQFNTVICCFKCNQSRGNLPFVDFYYLMKGKYNV